MLAQGGDDGKALRIYDTLGTPDGAYEAARKARKDGASIVFGPVFSGEVRSALTALEGAVPMVTFSNDAALRESGAFLLGVTAAQAVQAILGYAAGRGIRRVAVGGPDEGWGGQMRSAAQAIAPSLGLSLTSLPASDPGVMPPIAASDDGYPDAVVMPDPQALVEMMPALSSAGIQPLGAFSELDLSPDTVRLLEGSWVAAPDLSDFSDFAYAYEQRMGSRPGLLAGLAYDAMRIANVLRLSGGTDRSALLAVPRFEGVCGDVRFREDGSATRSMSIVQMVGGRIGTIATGAAR